MIPSCHPGRRFCGYGPGSNLLFATLIIGGCAAVPQQPATTYEIVGYYPGWKGPVKVDARQLTVLNYAFLDICWDGQHGNPAADGLAPCTAPNGSMVFTNPEADAANLAHLAAVKATHPKLKLVPSVGGWTRSNRFSDMVADPGTRRTFIDSVVAFLRRHRFDGIDIDWEYPQSIGVPCATGYTCDRATDKQSFVTLGREMRAALDAAGTADGKRYLFTIAAGADRKWLFDKDSSAWMVELAKSLDWINLMTYDYHGNWEAQAGYVAPLLRDPADPTPANADDSVALYLGEGIAPTKLTLGMPFYGKGWEQCAPGPKGDGLYQSCVGPVSDRPEGAYSFAELVEEGYLAKDAGGKYTVGGRGFKRYWNGAARVPYLYSVATKVFISYDDEASIREKNRYVIEKRLRGAMFWELNADRNNVLGRIIAEDLPH